MYEGLTGKSVTELLQPMTDVPLKEVLLHTTDGWRLVLHWNRILRLWEVQSVFKIKSEGE